MSKLFRFVVLSVFMAFIVILSACSNNGNSGGENASGQEGKTEGAEGAEASVRFKMFAMPDNRIENIETNEFTAYLEDRQKINIDWMTVPGGQDVEQKKNLLMSTGDYPEVMWSTFTPAEQYKYSQSGALIPLDDLINQYAPNVKKAMETNERYKNGVTAADGKIYALSQLGECFHCSYSQKLWINKAWLDKLGLQLPKTTEEFYAVLKAFKTQDPNGNGKEDEIPLTGAVGTWNGELYGFLVNPFILNNRTDFTVTQNGKVTFVGDKPEYKQALEYLNQLYKEKLIDAAAFTQNLDSMSQLINSADRVGAFTAGHVAMGATLDSPFYKNYVALSPLEGPGGLRTTGYFPSGFNTGGFSITKKATNEQAIAAIKMFDYLMTEEGTLRATFGTEGQFWSKPPEGAKDFEGKPAKYLLNPELVTDTKIQNLTWHGMGQVGLTNEMRVSFVAPEDVFSPEAYEYRLYRDTKDNYEPYTPKEGLPPALPLLPDDQDRLAQLQTDIKKYMEENTVRFITGDQNIESGWDGYAASYSKLKVDEYLGILQKGYEQLKK
ncbi:extracellular solute-binding protein [Paenibacillus pasadenensis]|uniref:extracellular solute-binding protein n=1 Tax=Paenibacillus pasadenensis TaxID=217090 RepID=UPI002041115F|nr:extracellular solute-binding protein [Paenibacillus pasadenensis]MCM3746870.1 extracellular solute-binding protein [Paenibacillus pasadenensis]